MIRWNRVVAITGDCKSPAVRLRRFESYFQHQFIEHDPNYRLFGRFFWWEGYSKKTSYLQILTTDKSSVAKLIFHGI